MTYIKDLKPSTSGFSSLSQQNQHQQLTLQHFEVVAVQKEQFLLCDESSWTCVLIIKTTYWKTEELDINNKYA